MSTTDETKSAGKSKRRKGKGGKKAVSQAAPAENPAVELPNPDQERPRPARVKSPKAATQPAIEEPVNSAATSPEPLPAIAPPPSEPVSAAPPADEPKSAEPEPAEPESAGPESAELKSSKPEAAEPISAEPPPAAPSTAEPAPVELAPVNLQTIANAYRDYTRKSIEEFGSFVEQLSGARSLDKAMTVQTEFVKRAYETSVAESQKICELHNRLAKQALDPFKGLTGTTPATHGKR
jgi:phasin family protein